MKCGFFVKAVPAVFVGDTVTKILSGVEMIISRVIETLDFGGKKSFLTNTRSGNHLFTCLSRDEQICHARRFKALHPHGGLLAHGFEREKFQSRGGYHHGQLRDFSLRSLVLQCSRELLIVLDQYVFHHRRSVHFCRHCG